MHDSDIATTIRLLTDAASPSTPDPALWSRIVTARERTLRARRRRRATFAASACAIALACGVAWRVPQRGSIPAIASLATGQHESRALEAEWRSIASKASPDPAALAPLRVVDAALQSAYERHAAPDELGSLWSERNRALRALIDHHDANGNRAPIAVTRI